jgi:hypothetical protein
MIQEGLCIPKCSMRDNLLKEKHNGGLAGLFVHDKTFVQLSNSYYWSRYENRCDEIREQM